MFEYVLLLHKGETIREELFETLEEATNRALDLQKEGWDTYIISLKKQGD